MFNKVSTKRSNTPADQTAEWERTTQTKYDAKHYPNQKWTIPAYQQVEAKRTDLDDHQIIRLSDWKQTTNPKVRATIAHNPTIEPYYLNSFLRYGNEPNIEVRLYAFDNPTLTWEYIDGFLYFDGLEKPRKRDSQEDFERIINAILLRPNLTVDNLEFIFTNWYMRDANTDGRKMLDTVMGHPTSTPKLEKELQIYLR